MDQYKNEASVDSRVTFPWKSGIKRFEIFDYRVLFDKVGGDRFEIGGGDDLLLGHNNADFTVSFELTVTEYYAGRWRNVFHKGVDDGIYDRSPAMWLNPNNNTLHFRMSTTANSNDGSDTYKQLVANVPTHIIYMKVGSQLHLYMDNVLDKAWNLSSATVSSLYPFSIGGDMHDSYDSAGSMFANLQIHEKALTAEERTTVSSGEVVRDGLSAYYDFEGTDPFRDKSGNGHHGTSFGSPTILKKGKSALFDGSNDKITIPAHSDFVFGTDPFAVVANGVRFDYTNGSAYHHIFTIGDQSNFALKAWEGNQVYFWNGSNKVQWTALQRDKIFDVALIRYGTGTNQTKMYIDGILVAEGTDTKNYILNLNPKIGNAWGTEYTKGVIGEIQIYRGDVPPEDKIDFIRTNPLRTLGLIALYDFEGDLPFSDKSGNGHDGTQSGGVRIVSL